MSDALITESLETWAERSGDVVPMVFERFFALSEESAALMRHSDAHMQGRMFEAVVDLLTNAEHLEPGGYLDWELDNHIVAYAATAPMYAAFFTAVLDCVRDSLGADWSDAYAQAWQTRIERIMHQVRLHPGHTTLADPA